MMTAIRRVRITWIERGTRNAAVLGLDELIDTAHSDDEILENALYAAECQDVDLDRYEPVIEAVPGPAASSA
jgi:hypothetical protein